MSWYIPVWDEKTQAITGWKKDPNAEKVWAEPWTMPGSCLEIAVAEGHTTEEANGCFSEKNLKCKDCPWQRAWEEEK